MSRCKARLAQEIAGDDEEFATELVSAFIMSGEEAILELRAAAHRQDLDQLARAAHKLKGAANNMHVTDSGCSRRMWKRAPEPAVATTGAKS